MTTPPDTAQPFIARTATAPDPPHIRTIDQLPLHHHTDHPECAPLQPAPLARPLKVDGTLATLYDARTLHSREVVRAVVDHFGERVFHTVISRTVKFPDATLAAEPITTYSSDHSGANAYRQLARELIARGDAA